MIEVGEKFNLGKFFSGMANPVTGAKSIVIGLWIVLFIVIGFTVYRAYFKKQPPTTTQNAEHIDAPNYYLQPRFGGCASIKIPQE